MSAMKANKYHFAFSINIVETFLHFSYISICFRYRDSCRHNSCSVQKFLPSSKLNLK